MADIDKLMGELQTARDYLQSEGEKVRWMTARYAHLAQTVMRQTWARLTTTNESNDQ